MVCLSSDASVTADPAASLGGSEVILYVKYSNSYSGGEAETETAMSVQETIGKLGHLVDGEIVRGEPTDPVIDPSSGDVVAQVPVADAALLDRAISAAVRAQPAWAADVAARRAVINAMCDAIQANYAELDQLATLEKGVPGAGAELMAAVWYGRHIAAAPIPADIIQDDDEKTITLERAPVGVVAAIAPWNAPGLILSEKIFSAFLLGNTVVAKPSPFTPLATLRLAQLWQPVVPAGVLNVVTGPGAPTAPRTPPRAPPSGCGWRGRRPSVSRARPRPPGR